MNPVISPEPNRLSFPNFNPCVRPESVAGLPYTTVQTLHPQVVQMVFYSPVTYLQFIAFNDSFLAHIS